DAIDDLEALVLPHRVHLADEVVRAALELELRIERRVELDGDALRGRDRGALAAATLDEHLVRAELVPRGAEPSVAELLEVARLQCLLHLAQRGTEARPEHREIRLHAQLRVDGPELDRLDAHLVGDLIRMRRRAVRTLDDETPQRLAQLEPRRRAR